MKITLLVIGRTDETYLKEGIAVYNGRLQRYTGFLIKEIPALKHGNKMSEAEQKRKEGELILGTLDKNDKLILLDDKGREQDSEGFAKFIRGKLLDSTKSLVFVVGGPYGFSEAVRERAGDKISLSKLTFSHQMVRLIFVEQLYRAYTILKGEKYHHS